MRAGQWGKLVKERSLDRKDSQEGEKGVVRAGSMEGVKEVDEGKSSGQGSGASGGKKEGSEEDKDDKDGKEKDGSGGEEAKNGSGHIGNGAHGDDSANGSSDDVQIVAEMEELSLDGED